MDALIATNRTSWNEFLESNLEQNSRLFTYDADIMPLAKESSLAASATSNSSVSSVSSLTSISINRPKILVPALFGGDGHWRETSMIVFPLREIIRQGWHILISLMGTNKADDGTIPNHIGNYCRDTMINISILQNFQLKTRDEILRLFNGDLYASYLAGCSIVWENCDMISPYIAALCQDLQGEQDRKDETERGGAFRQAYATAHLCPPQTFEISPTNTNERDVLVFQLVGRRYWKTSWMTPQNPSSSPGNAGHSETTGGKKSEGAPFSGFLYPGDVLYIPRGMSYQTQTSSQSQPQSETQNQAQPSTQMKTSKIDGDAEDDDETDPSLNFYITVAVEQSDELIARVKGIAVKIRPSASPDTNSSSTNIVSVPKIQDPNTRTDTDHIIALSRKRTLLIEQAKLSSPLLGRPLKRKLNPQESISLASPAVGPTAASEISFRAEIRGATQAERQYAQELLFRGNNARINERWIAGIRRELHGVASVFVDRFRSLSSSVESVPPRRVVDLCELVKDSFEDKSEISLACDLTLLALVKREVVDGNLAIVHPT
jgi:hypothetical protein